MALRPNACHGLLIFWGFLATHNDASHSIGLLRTGDQLVAETSTWQHTTLATNIQTSMPPVGFEPTVSASERPQTYALDRASTGTGIGRTVRVLNNRNMSFNICHPEVFNTHINIQWCISQTQQHFIMFIIVLGQHVSTLTESSSGPSKNTDPYFAVFKICCWIPNAYM